PSRFQRTKEKIRRQTPQGPVAIHLAVSLAGRVQSPAISPFSSSDSQSIRRGAARGLNRLENPTASRPVLRSPASESPSPQSSSPPFHARHPKKPQKTRMAMRIPFVLPDIPFLGFSES